MIEVSQRLVAKIEWGCSFQSGGHGRPHIGAGVTFDLQEKSEHVRQVSGREKGKFKGPEVMCSRNT